MAFPCPATDSLAPMDHFLSFDVSLIIPKNIRKVIYAAFSSITTYIRGYSPYSRVHRDVYIIQILLECSLTWIRLIWLLAFHMPWDRSDSTLHYPLWSYIRNPLVHWKGGGEKEERIESIETIVHCCQYLCLSLHPFVPWSTVVFFPIFPFASKLSIEVMEDWVGGGPSGGFSFSGSQTCRQRLSLVISYSY